MTVRIEAGWDHDVIGTATITIDDPTDGQWSVSISTGTYSHQDLSSATGASTYTDFATALQTAMNASGDSTDTFTVSYSTSTLRYTITSNGSRNFTLKDPTATTARKVMGQILGFTSEAVAGSSSPTDAVTGDALPWYIISPAVGALSDRTDDYEPSGIAIGDETEDGSHYSIARTASPTYNDFAIMLEGQAACFKRDATNSSPWAYPWTYQHFFEHVRSIEPFLIVDSDASENTVHMLRPGSANWNPDRRESDHNLYDIRFDTYVEGRL